MDLLAGFAGDDTLSGSGGDDLLIGDTGDPAFGAVVRVQDFNPDEDRLEVPTTWQGDVEITPSEVDQGVMVPVDGTDTIHLPGLRADQVNVADIVLSRIGSPPKGRQGRRLPPGLGPDLVRNPFWGWCAQDARPTFRARRIAP